MEWSFGTEQRDFRLGLLDDFAPIIDHCNKYFETV